MTIHQFQDSKFYKKLLIDDSKRGVLTTNYVLRHIRIQEDGNFKYSLLKEKVISDLDGFAIDRNSFMFEMINQKVVEFVESGATEKILSKYKYEKVVKEEMGPKVLNLGHLSAGFNVWLVCIAISISSFAIEIFVASCKIAILKKILYFKNQVKNDLCELMKSYI